MFDRPAPWGPFLRVCLAGTLVAMALPLSAAKSLVATWELETRRNVLELRQDGEALFISKLGPKNGEEGKLESMPLISATVAGKRIAPGDLSIKKVEQSPPQDGVTAVTATLAHRTEPVVFTVTYSAWSDTGVWTCDVLLKNVGEQLLQIDRCSSFCFALPTCAGELHYLDGSPWKGSPGIERQFKSTKLASGEFQLDNGQSGRSTPDKSLWWSLYQPAADLSYTAQMAYSGNWSATFQPREDGSRKIEMGMTFDNEGPLGLQPGQSFQLPRVALMVTEGRGLDAAIQASHRFQRKYVIPKQPQNNPLLVQYNTWYGLWRGINAENISVHIPLAAKMGCEVFVIDATWHCCPGRSYSTNWTTTLGDWVVNPKTFPDGLAPLIKSIHEHGMKFGLWFEPECASLNSNLLNDHPDWFLTYQGKPIVVGPRVHLDYAKPEVRAWMTSIIDGFMKQGPLDWIKLDYNIDIGNRFDATGDIKTNTRLHDHLQGYYQWLEELAKKYPDLIIENCSSGGRRSDLGILARTHTGWISDTVNPRYSVQCAWGALVEMPPEICNHWMAGDMGANKPGGLKATITTTDPQWWDFMFRIAMNGQFGISSRMDAWPDGAMQRGAENVALYKRIRTVIHGSDVYHLTDAPQAGYNPEGWMAIQYLRPDPGKCVVMVFRLGESTPTETFRLRGLDPAAIYIVRRDGKTAEKVAGSRLIQDGIAVQLEKEWHSQVIELEKEQNSSVER